MKRIIVGSILILISICWWIVSAVHFLNQFQEQVEQLSVPGSHKITISEPGTYTLFHVYRGFHEGRVINVSSQFPNGTVIELTDASQRLVPPLVSRGNMHTQSNDTAKQSVQSWNLSPGSYSLTVENLDSPHVVTLEQFEFFKIFLLIAAMIIGGIIAFGGGILLIVFGIISRVKQKKADVRTFEEI